MFVGTSLKLALAVVAISARTSWGYPGRQQGPINMNTLSGGGPATYGSQIKTMTYSNSIRGTAQQQFYINWQNDTKK
jgi:hypothetical protein